MQKSKERWVSIPEIVFTDYELPEGARLLYGEVNALSRREGRCWASNAHFASRLGKSRATISRWIDSLVKRGHIRRVLVDKGNGDFARHLIPTVTAGDGLSTKGDTRNATPVVTDDKAPHQEREGELSPVTRGRVADEMPPLTTAESHNKISKLTTTSKNETNTIKEKEKGGASPHRSFSFFPEPPKEESAFMAEELNAIRITEREAIDLSERIRQAEQTVDEESASASLFGSEGSSNLVALKGCLEATLKRMDTAKENYAEKREPHSWRWDDDFNLAGEVPAELLRDFQWTCRRRYPEMKFARSFGKELEAAGNCVRLIEDSEWKYPMSEILARRWLQWFTRECLNDESPIYAISIGLLERSWRKFFGQEQSIEIFEDARPDFLAGLVADLRTATSRKCEAEDEDGQDDEDAVAGAPESDGAADGAVASPGEPDASQTRPAATSGAIGAGPQRL